MRVSTADFIKAYDIVADRALTEPVTITKNGLDRLVLLSVAEYERLRRRDRRAFRAEDLTDEEIAEIAASEMDPRHDHLNAELGNWRP